MHSIYAPPSVPLSFRMEISGTWYNIYVGDEMLPIVLNDSFKESPRWRSHYNHDGYPFYSHETKSPLWICKGDHWSRGRGRRVGFTATDYVEVDSFRPVLLDEVINLSMVLGNDITGLYDASQSELMELRLEMQGTEVELDQLPVVGKDKRIPPVILRNKNRNIR